MITKEVAASIYNIYSQLDTCDKFISDLQEFIKECDNHVPDIIDESYKTYGSIQLEVPYFESGRFKTGSARLFNINYSLALKVIKSHKRMLKNRLKKINNEINLQILESKKGVLQRQE